MPHPFADLIGLQMVEVGAGASRCTLTVVDEHLNPNGVAHGAVLYALADTGMGAALSEMLADGELCATIQIKMNYFKPVFAGTVNCATQVVNRGKRIAHLESRLTVDDALVATASGNYSIFVPTNRAQP